MRSIIFRGISGGHFEKIVRDELSKFNVADRNRDGSLDHEEYSAFLHPPNYDYMHRYEVDRAMADYDVDNDHVITFDEYLGQCKSTVNSCIWKI